MKSERSRTLDAMVSLISVLDLASFKFMEYRTERRISKHAITIAIKMAPSTDSPPFSFTYRMSRRIENFMDLESRLQQCESKIRPMTRSEARERIRYETKVCIKLRTQQNGGGAGAGAPIQRRPTPLNDPLIRDRLIDQSELEDKMIALDFRLKMDRCLQEKSHHNDTLATTTFYSRQGVLTG
jgi:hypothetical protein